MPVEDLTKDKLADAGAVPASSTKNASTPGWCFFVS